MGVVDIAAAFSVGSPAVDGFLVFLLFSVALLAIILGLAANGYVTLKLPVGEAAWCNLGAVTACAGYVLPPLGGMAAVSIVSEKWPTRGRE